MPEEALELKKNLRCDMKARRNALTDEEKKHAAANCLSKLKELPEFMNADWIYAYIACRNELETADIISWCLSYGKHVAVFIKGKSWDKHKAWSCDSVFFFSCWLKDTKCSGNTVR